MRIRASRWWRNDQPPNRGAAVAQSVSAERARCIPVEEHVTRLVVDVGNRARAWRDAALEAQAAFETWTDAALRDRGEAASVYLAAIEREEKAASEYSRAVEACRTPLP